jgi:hypothetical protein
MQQENQLSYIVAKAISEFVSLSLNAYLACATLSRWVLLLRCRQDLLHKF